MKKLRNNLGFTLAELMLTVSILLILAGVGFVGVSHLQRSMYQRQMDGYAKELFVAAQNHLTMAKSEGKLAVLRDTVSSQNSVAVLGKAEDSRGIYGFVNRRPGSGSSVLDLMLPFGAVDDDVRTGGNYIIRYQLSTARVLDVFYAQRSGNKSYSFLDGDYEKLTKDDTYRSADGAREKRGNYDGNGAIIGYFGGEQADELTYGRTLSEPTIEVVNGVRLEVHVDNPNCDDSDAKLKLLITGLTSGKSEELSLPNESVDETPWVSDTSSGKRQTFTVVLDDVTTAGRHFGKICSDLIPGEDITIQAMAYNNNDLTNVAYSSGITTNSLFAALRNVESDGEGNITAATAIIGNCRHLENLDPDVSDVYQKSKQPLQSEKTVHINKAHQVADLDWADFKEKIHEITHVETNATKLYLYSDLDNNNSAGNLRPVNLYGADDSSGFEYSGRRGTYGAYRIQNITVNYNGPAGVFGTVPGASTVDYLQLVDCTVTATGSGNSAGTLAGKMDNVRVTNVVAYHSKETGADATVVGDANAGGLVGECTGNCVLTRCGAAVKVTANNSGNAGGLVGSAAASFNSCYTGGRTLYETTRVSFYSDSDSNVTATYGSAGGLVGFALSGTAIQNSYSTCSASGVNAGGLVGSSASATITNCYATGLVKGDNKGGLVGAGNVSFTTGEDNKSWYLSTVNNSNAKSPTVFAVGGTAKDTGNVGPFDEDLTTYRKVAAAAENSAVPYNSMLESAAKGWYDFKTVRDLLTGDAASNVPAFVNVHHGDWPTPGALVENEKSAG